MKYVISFLCLWISNITMASMANAAPVCSQANTTQVAVTADFSATFITLSRQFSQQMPYCVKQSVASTGVLYTEITHGAPFDIFLAADSKRPMLLTTQGLASPKQLFTYATGQLVLLAPQQPAPFAVEQFLRTKNIKLAISNPELAPYGLAAKQTLTSLQLWPQLKDHLLMANDVNQALMYVTEGGADCAFISLAQIKHAQQMNKLKPDQDSYWLVPQTLHQPITQQAVLLKTAENNPAALAFFHYLQSEPARKIIHEAGYL